MTVRKAVVPAAGLGTRMLPATKAVPKEMLPIGRRPAIEEIVEECAASGIEVVVLVTGRGKGALEDHFDEAPELERALEDDGKHELLESVRTASGLAEVVGVRQHRARGLGHAVLCARAVIGDDEPFAVVLPDDLVLDAPTPATRQLADVHADTDTGVVGLVEVPSGEESRYGIVAAERTGAGHLRCTDMVEKPSPSEAPSNLGIVGRYVLPGRIFAHLAETRPGKGGEIQLTDALAALMREEGFHGRLLEGSRFDTGQLGGYLEACLARAMAEPELAERLRRFVHRRG